MMVETEHGGFEHVPEGDYIRIVQPRAKDSGVTPTQGTLVMVGDVQVKGVYKIELLADTNDVWRAVVHCHPKWNEMTALASFSIVHPKPTICDRVKAWFLK